MEELKMCSRDQGFYQTGGTEMTAKQTPLVDLLRIHADDIHSAHGHNKSSTLLSQAADRIATLEAERDRLKEKLMVRDVWSERDRLRSELAEANKAATDMESALYEASAEFERLARANERLRGALGEVMEWIDAWEPGFVGTEGWEDTRAKIRAAFAGEGETK